MAQQQNLAEDIEQAMYLFTFSGKDGKITGSELGPVLRSIFLNPTESTLKEMVREVDSSYGGRIDAKGISALINKFKKELMITTEELRDAFSIFDKQGNGTVVSQDFRHSLTTLGEKLSDDQVDEFIRAVDPDGEGTVPIEDLVKVLLAKY